MATQYRVKPLAMQQKQKAAALKTGAEQITWALHLPRLPLHSMWCSVLTLCAAMITAPAALAVEAAATADGSDRKEVAAEVAAEAKAEHEAQEAAIEAMLTESNGLLVNPESATDAEVQALWDVAASAIEEELHGKDMLESEEETASADDEPELAAADNGATAAAASDAASDDEGATLVDPLAKERDQSFLKRLFGSSINEAAAGSDDNIATYSSTFFVPDRMTDFSLLQEQADESNGVDLLATVPFKLTEDMLLPQADKQNAMVEQIHAGISYVSYLLHMYTPHATQFHVPVLFVNAESLRHVSNEYNIAKGTTLVGSGAAIIEGENQEQGQQHKVPEQQRYAYAQQLNRQLNNMTLTLDGIYNFDSTESGGATADDPECAGMTLIEADLKGKCKTEQAYNGLVLLTMPIPEIAKEGIYTGQPRQVTPNVLKANYFAQGVDVGARLVGFNSAYDPRSNVFTAPLHSFDKHLYSPTLHSYVKPGMSLKEISDKCSQTKQDEECQLYFVGPNVSRLLSVGNEHSEYNLKQKGTFDVGTPYARISEEALSHKKLDQDADADNNVTMAAAGSEAEAALEQAVQQDDAKPSVTKAAVAAMATAQSALPKAKAQAAAAAATTDEATETATATTTADAVAAADSSTNSSGDSASAGASDSTKRTSPALLAATVASSEIEAATQTFQHRKNSQAKAVADAAVTATANEEAAEETQHDLYGMQISFGALGKPYVWLRNTLLSRDQYKNYNFLTEAEMAMLSDMGYRMEPREFFGRSIYSYGSAERRVLRTVSNNFGLYDHATETYDERKPSTTPLAVGLHVYGSYNDIVHRGNVLSAGDCSVGVRIDGSENYYYQTNKSSITASGDNGIGIAFTYGRDNRAYISGYVSALGSYGIGIKVDMGSNIYSDLIEYRGSYVRVRTLDYLHGMATEEEAAKFPLLQELNGPQVSALTIDGVVEGTNAAIYIDESSLVKDINVTANAVLNGGIYSTWSPRAMGNGEIIVTHDSRKSLIDGVVQIPRDPDLTANEFIQRHLMTNINLGVTLDDKNRVVYRDLAQRNPKGNDKARVVLSGDVSGSSFNIRQLAGKSTILGNVRANQIDVVRGILSLCPPQDEGTFQLASLRIRRDAVLDLVNGKSSHAYISGDVRVGSNAVVRVDVDSEGNIIDDVKWNGEFSVRNYQLSLEPGLRYNDLRRLSADPMEMLNFITNFVQNANQRFASENVTVRMPHYIWDSAGNYGRELRCNARGCRVGAFVASNKPKVDITGMESWRYYVSGFGLLALVIATYVYLLVERIRHKRQNKAAEAAEAA